MLARAGRPKTKKAPNWTAAEDEILRRLYRSADKEAITRALPGRSWGPIRQRAHVLEVIKKRPWTETENRRLMFLWESGLRLSAIGHRLKRTAKATYEHARLLGLRVGRPDGFEYLTEAERRTGFYTSTLRRILAAAGVKLHLSLTDPCMRRGPHRAHFVDPDKVDDAIRQWMATETVTAAARRIGITDDALRLLLRKRGLIPAPRKGFKTQQRQLPEVFDRVVAEHRGTAA